MLKILVVLLGWGLLFSGVQAAETSASMKSPEQVIWENEGITDLPQYYPRVATQDADGHPLIALQKERGPLVLIKLHLEGFQLELARFVLPVALGHDASEYDKATVRHLLCDAEGNILVAGSLVHYIGGHVGNNSSYNRAYGFLIKLNGSTGNILWSVKFAPYGEMDHEITYVLENDQGYVYSTQSTYGSYGANTPTYPKIICANKTTGETLLQNRADQAHLGSNVGFAKIVPTSDGGFLALGKTNAATAPGYGANYSSPSSGIQSADAYIVKYGPAEEGSYPLQWDRTTGTYNSDTATHAVPYSNGYLLAVAYAHGYGSDSPYVIDGNSYSRYGYGRNIFLHQIEADGTTRWIQNYGSNGAGDYLTHLSIENGSPYFLGHVSANYYYNPPPGGDVVGATAQKNVWAVYLNQGNSPTIAKQSSLGYEATNPAYFLYETSPYNRHVMVLRDGTILIMGYNTTTSCPWFVRTLATTAPEPPKFVDLAIDLQESQGTGGNSWVHRLIISNKGPDAASNVLITYNLPQGMEAISVLPDTYTYNSESHSLQWDLASLSANAENNDEYVVETQLKEGVPPETEMKGEAQISAEEEELNELDNVVQRLLGGAYFAAAHIGISTVGVSYSEIMTMSAEVYNTGIRPIRPEFSFALPKGITLLTPFNGSISDAAGALTLQQSGDTFSWSGSPLIETSQNILFQAQVEITDWNKDLDYIIPFAMQMRAYDDQGKVQIQKSIENPVYIIRPDLQFEAANRSVIVSYDQTSTIPFDFKTILFDRQAVGKCGNILLKVQLQNPPLGVELKQIDRLKPGDPAPVKISDTLWEMQIPSARFQQFNFNTLIFELGPFDTDENRNVTIQLSAEYLPDSQFYEEHEVSRVNDTKTVVLEIKPSRKPEVELLTKANFEYDLKNQEVRHTTTAAYKFKNTDTLQRWTISQEYLYLNAGERIDDAVTLSRPNIVSSGLNQSLLFDSGSGSKPPTMGIVSGTFRTRASIFKFATPLLLRTTISMTYEVETGGEVLTEVVVVDETFSFEYPKPVVVWPLKGELLHPEGGFTVTGWTLPNRDLEIYRTADGATLAETRSSAQGAFFAYIPGGKAYVENDLLTLEFAVALVDTNSESVAIKVYAPRSCWCPNRSEWIGTDAKGNPHIFRFTNPTTGEVTTSNWQIPGVYGFWNTTLKLYALTEAADEIYVIADGVKYLPERHPGNFYVFHIKRAHNVKIHVPCQTEYPSESNGVVLIDPDGFVYDSTLGWGNVVPGAKVTCMEYLPASDSWQQWPAEIYEDQINPQIVGEDGYFAFFTPAGTYHLLVEEPAGYQSWRSKDLQVIAEVVHQNVPYTPLINEAADKVLYVGSLTIVEADGSDASDLSLPEGSVVRWVSQPAATASNEDLLQLAKHPVNQVRTLDFDPDADLRGFDSGLLAPFEEFTYKLDYAGVYRYRFSSGGEASITVLAADPQEPVADTQKPTAPGALQGTVVGYTVQLGWTAATDDTAVTGYDVMRRLLPTGEWSVLSTVAPELSVFTDNTASAGKTYMYGVVARDAAGNMSVSSNLVTAQLPALPEEPEPEPVKPEVPVVEPEEPVEEKPWRDVVLPFADVDLLEDAALVEALQYLYMRGIIRGKQDGRFDAEAVVSRAEWVVILHRAFAGEEAGEVRYAAYLDVGADAWFGEAVAWLSRNGIVRGNGSGRFLPDEPLSGEHLELMLQRCQAVFGVELPGLTFVPPITRAHAALAIFAMYN